MTHMAKDSINIVDINSKYYKQFVFFQKITSSVSSSEMSDKLNKLLDNGWKIKEIISESTFINYIFYKIDKPTI